MSIQLILGPMFAGKTTELLRQGRRAELAGKRVLYVKHRSDCQRYPSDDPYAQNVRIHHEPEEGPNVGREALNAELFLHEVWEQMAERWVQVICIDEGQFFPDLRPVLLYMTNVLKKQVIVAALNATYKQELFPSVADLIPLATSVQWLTAICFKCGSNEATFTHRLPEADRRLGHEMVETARQAYEPEDLEDWEAGQLRRQNIAVAQANLVGGKESYKALCRECHYTD